MELSPMHTGVCCVKKKLVKKLLMKKCNVNFKLSNTGINIWFLFLFMQDGTYSEHGMPFGQSTNDVCSADLNGLYEAKSSYIFFCWMYWQKTLHTYNVLCSLWKAHVGSLTHLLTAEDDFDPRFDYSFEVKKN